MPEPPSHVGLLPVGTFKRQNSAETSVMTFTAPSERKTKSRWETHFVSSSKNLIVSKPLPVPVEVQMGGN